MGEFTENAGDNGGSFRKAALVHDSQPEEGVKKGSTRAGLPLYGRVRGIVQGRPGSSLTLAGLSPVAKPRTIGAFATDGDMGRCWNQPVFSQAR